MNSVLRKSLLWPVLVALVYTTATASGPPEVRS